MAAQSCAIRLLTIAFRFPPTHAPRAFRRRSTRRHRPPYGVVLASRRRDAYVDEDLMQGLVDLVAERVVVRNPDPGAISARSVQRGGGLGGWRWAKVDERWGLCEGTGLARAPRCGCEVVTAGRRSPTAGAAPALLPIPSRSDVAKLTEAGAQRLSHSRTRGIQTGAHSRRQEFSFGSAAATSGSCDLAPSAATDRKPTAAALSGFSIFMLSCARRRDSISAWIAHRAGTRTGWGVGSAWNAGLHWRRRVRHAGRPPGRTIASAQPVGRPSAAVLPRHSRPPPGP